MKRWKIGAWLAAGCWWAVGLAGAAERKPNFVFILVDDLGYADVACYGNTLHETPNVDRLAREGMRFTDAYAACAVCSPTRAALQTGKYPARLGITDWIPGAKKKNTKLKERFTATYLPKEAVTIAESLKARGYRTGFVGKWHLNHEGDDTYYPEDQGYEINIGGCYWGQPKAGYFAPFKNPKMPDLPDDYYLTDRQGNDAAAYIRERAKDPKAPFLLMLCFYTVHAPIQPKPELKAKYEEKLKQTPGTRWRNPNYAAMVQSMDDNVGKVLAALKESGAEENTVVFFNSDNGGLGMVTDNYPLSQSKGYYHEGGIRVPLIVRYPGTVAAGSACGVPVITNDYFPTMLELAGLPLEPDHHMDGLSLVPLLKGGGDIGREALYWHYPHYHGSGETPASAMRMGNYKFIRHYEDGLRELYDLGTDIGEAKNLVDAQAEKAAEMEKKLDAWLKEMKGYIPGPNPEYDPAAKPEGKKKKEKGGG